MCPWQPHRGEDRRQSACLRKRKERGEGERSSCQELYIHINSLLADLQFIQTYWPFTIRKLPLPFQRYVYYRTGRQPLQREKFPHIKEDKGNMNFSSLCILSRSVSNILC